MPNLPINPVYLPLSRDLNYQTQSVINGDIVLEAQSGDIIPVNTADMPIFKIFSVNNVSVTQAELNLLQDFYRRYYYQKFRFIDKNDPTKTLFSLDVPNGMRTQFNLINDNPNLEYLLNSAKIYVDNQGVNNATLNQDLQIIFTTPPANNSIIKVIIEYDYAVMFDYDFGLQSAFDSQSQSYKINFRLCT